MYCNKSWNVETHRSAQKWHQHEQQEEEDEEVNVPTLKNALDPQEVQMVDLQVRLPTSLHFWDETEWIHCILWNSHRD